MRKDQLSKKAWENKKKNTTKWIKNRCETDDLYKKLRTTRTNLSVFFRKVLEGKNPNSRNLEKITGLTSKELAAHLLNSTSADITRHNYGSVYEIDHIVPVSKYQELKEHLSIEVIIELCFKPSNLRIIEKKNNRPGKVA